MFADTTKNNSGQLSISRGQKQHTHTPRAVPPLAKNNLAQDMIFSKTLNNIRLINY